MSDGDGRAAGTSTRRELLASTSIALTSLAGCLEVGSSGPRATPAPPDDAVNTSTVSPPATPTTTETARPSPTPEPPAEDYVYVGERQLRAVADQVNGDESPWIETYNRAVKDAEKALDMSPKSVVDDGAPKWDDPHRFGTTDDRHDYAAAIDMTTAVRDAALGYWFTDDDKYAQRAIDLLYHWCLDPETQMKPNANMANNGTFIETLVTVPKLWYGASLIRGHPYWTEKNGDDLETEFRSWARSFVESFPDPGYYQYDNHWAWRIATIAGAASYLGDEELLEQAFCMWRGQCKTAAHDKDRPRPWGQYQKDGDGTGYLRQELTRTDALNYHIYGMKALTVTAEIGRQNGVDLYSYNAPTDPDDGPTLKKLFDFMVPYLKSISEWEWGKGSEGVTDLEVNNYASLFEIAYSRWQEPEYLEVVQALGRPAYDFWIFGWTTLTHGSWFKLDDF